MTASRSPDLEGGVAASSTPRTRLPFHETLLFRFAALFLVLLALAGFAATLAVDRLVDAPLEADARRHELQLARSLAGDVRLAAVEAQEAAVALASLAASQRFARSTLDTEASALIASLPDANLYAAFGLWPEPNQTGAGIERASLYWTREASGRFSRRDDYNDPATAPYFQEDWYTPARFTPEGRCYWTPAQQAPLAKIDVVTCTAPVRINGVYAGAASVSLDLDRLGARFNSASATLPGYALLLDRRGRALASGGANGMPKLATGRDIAELAQREAAYNPLALRVHARMKAQDEAALHGNQYEPTKISALQDATREHARADAEDALFWLWTRDAPAAEEALDLDADPVFGTASLVAVVPVADTGFTLVRAASRQQGLAGVRYLVQRAMLVAAALASVPLLLAFIALGGFVVRPLQRMAQRLIASDGQDDALIVARDLKSRTEIGLVALWQNERLVQLTDLRDRMSRTNSQLIVEASERSKAQDQLVRAHELQRALTETVTQAVLVCDERGSLVNLNPVAERMLGQSLDSARGRSIQEVLVAQIGDSGESLADAVMDTMQRGTPTEFSDGVLLRGIGGFTEITASLAPLIGRGARAEGCVVLFGEATRHVRGATELSPEPELDAQTGLGGRPACERRVRAVLDKLDADGGSATVLVVDAEGLGRISEQAGVPAGNDALMKLTELLLARSGGRERLFRLPGEQFALVLDALPPTEAKDFAEELRSTLEAQNLGDEDNPQHITPNIGLAPIDAGFANAAEVVRRASRAATAVRQDGGPGVRVFEPAMDRETANGDELWVGRIRRGLDEELFHLSTQWIAPSESLADEGSGFELLLALEDEEGFWSPPAAFLPVVERQGMSSEVDQWVVERVLRMLDSDPRLSSLAFVNINVAAGTIADSGFLDYLADAFGRYPNVSPSKLCFDLALGAASDPATDTPAFCSTVRLMGARTCLSSGPLRKSSDLDMLRRLPVDILAFDAPLFPRIAEDPAEALLAESLIGITRVLGRRALITRIETPQQEAAWRKAGADYFQGYAIARPTPVMFQVPAGR